MKHTHTLLTEDGKRTVYIAQCEYCGYGLQALKKLNLELLALMNCPECKVNSHGDIDHFDIETIRPTQE